MTFQEMQYNKVFEFSICVRKARLHRMEIKESLNKSELDERHLRTVDDACYMTALDCLALETHRLTQNDPPIFTMQIQDAFSHISQLIDRHLEPGWHDVDRRLALLNRAAECLDMRDFDVAFDSESVADRVNEVAGRRAVYKFLFAGYDATDGRAPDFSGGPDEDFTPADARELVLRIGSLFEVIQDHVAKPKQIFSGPGLDWVQKSCLVVHDLTVSPRTGAAIGKPLRAFDEVVAQHIRTG